jgi:hypothetical protein
VNFRFCVLKDELAWRVRDSVIALAHVCVCVCVFVGERWGEKPRSRAICCTNIFILSLVISNVAAPGEQALLR